MAEPNLAAAKMADPVAAAQRVEPILAAAQRVEPILAAAKMADQRPSPAAEIEMDSRCGGRTHGLGFSSVMEVQVGMAPAGYG